MLLIFAGGCQQRVASKLSGPWVGRPDTATARAKREAEKYGDDVESASDGSDDTTNDTKRAANQTTDWEEYPVTVLIDFVSSDRIEMSLGVGEQPKSGSWKVVATSPGSCSIEIQTVADVAEGTEDAKAPGIERRRFELLLDERDDTCVGFLLTEAGTDRQLGAIYFQRPQSTANTTSN